MSQNASRFQKPAIGFWYFFITSAVILTILQKVVFARSSFESFRNLPVIPFSIFLWIAYRVARMQPWWPFNEGGSMEITSVSAPRPPRDARSDTPKEARVTKVLTAKDLKRLHSSKLRTKVKEAFQAVTTVAPPSLAPKFDFVPIHSTIATSTGRVRFKTTRRKAVRQKTVGRSRRK